MNSIHEQLLLRTSQIQEVIPSAYRINNKNSKCIGASELLEFNYNGYIDFNTEKEVVLGFLTHCYYIESFSQWADSIHNKKAKLKEFYKQHDKIKELSNAGKKTGTLFYDYLLGDFLEYYNGHHKEIYYLKLAINYFDDDLLKITIDEKIGTQTIIARARKLINELGISNENVGWDLTNYEISPSADRRIIITVDEYEMRSSVEKIIVPSLPNSFI